MAGCCQGRRAAQVELGRTRIMLVELGGSGTDFSTSTSTILVRTRHVVSGIPDCRVVIVLCVRNVDQYASLNRYDKLNFTPGVGAAMYDNRRGAA